MAAGIAMPSQSDGETKHRDNDRNIASQGNRESPLVLAADIGQVEDSRNFRARFPLTGAAAADTRTP